MALPRRVLILMSVLLFSVGCDQASKVWATQTLKGAPQTSHFGDLFRLGYATNDGAFLSLGSGLPPPFRFLLLNVGVGLLLLAIVVFALSQKKTDAVQLSGYGMIAGGGISNWVDRARFDGSVVDFMNLGIGGLRTGIFNIADLAILAGIGCMLFSSWREDRLLKLARKSDAAGAGKNP